MDISASMIGVLMSLVAMVGSAIATTISYLGQRDKLLFDAKLTGVETKLTICEIQHQDAKAEVAVIRAALAKCEEKHEEANLRSQANSDKIAHLTQMIDPTTAVASPTK